MEKITKTISVIVFFLVLGVFAAISLLLPKQHFSDVENRTLQDFPSLSTESYFDSSYAKSLESWFCDHFAFRTGWISLLTRVELFAGKYEINGVYITDNRHIEHITEPDFAIVDESIDAINSFAANNEIPVYMLLAPTASGIYSNEIFPYAPQYDQESFINYVYAAVDDNVRVLDSFKSLSSASDEYIYYKNDHHWTSLGAYYAYYFAAARLGLSPVPFSRYNIERVSDDFYGTLYSKTLYDSFGGDSVDIFTCVDGISVESVTVNDGRKETVYDSLYFRDRLDTKDKYSVFLDGNNPLVTIKTTAQNGSGLLVIRDSYANCFVPFLTQHYSEITLVDMRYISVGLEYILDLDRFSQVLILYNAQGFAADTDLKKIT